jgi:lysophospholipase L1-like esterase
MSIKPSVLRWANWPEAVKANNMLKALVAKNPRLTYIDVATPFLQPNGQVMTDIFVPDNLHLNEKGYKIWTEAVRAVLIPAEGRYERSTSN